jgi:RNAse (barnase) inhibitor barstar
MASVVVDCKGVTSPQAFWERYVTVVKPMGAEHFGRNLDAFWDAVDGGGPGCPEQQEVEFVNTASLKKIQKGRFYEALRKIARESGGATRVTIE